MILRSFTQNSPLLPIFYPLVITLIILSGSNELLFLAQKTAFSWVNPTMLNISFITILSFNSLLANQIYNRSELYHSPVYLTGLIYAIYGAISSVQTGNLTALIGQSFSLIALYFCFSIFRQKKIAHYLFISALFMGIASLLEVHYLLFIFLLLFLSIWNRPFSFKDITLVIFGFFTPMLYWIATLWLTQNPESLISISPKIIPVHSYNAHSPSLTFIISVIIAIVFALISLAHKEDRQSNKTVQSKQYLTLFLILSVLANIVDYFFYQQFSINHVVSLAPILLLSQYWTHYRTSLLAPFVFYISMIIVLVEFFHWF